MATRVLQNSSVEGCLPHMPRVYLVRGRRPPPVREQVHGFEEQTDRGAAVNLQASYRSWKYRRNYRRGSCGKRWCGYGYGYECETSR